MLLLNTKRHSGYGLLLLSFIGLIYISVVQAEIRNNNTPLLRVRYGSNGVGGGSVGTVIYNPLIPTEFNGLAGVTTQTTAISTTPIPGSSGVYRVRIVTDVNAKGSVSAPLTGTFSYDSSNPLTCITPASCGTTPITFNKISWSTRDSDTLDTVTQYNGSSAQVFQIQTDISNSNNRLETRHRNYYRFEYLNDTLLPAGTYEGTVIINGSAL